MDNARGGQGAARGLRRCRVDPDGVDPRQAVSRGRQRHRGARCHRERSRGRRRQGPSTRSRSGHGMGARNRPLVSRIFPGLGTARSDAPPGPVLHRTRTPKLSAHPAIIGAKRVQALVGRVGFQLEVCRIDTSLIDPRRRQAAPDGASRRRRGRWEGGRCVTGTGQGQAPRNAGAHATVADRRGGPRWPRDRRSQSRRISIGPSRPPAKTWTCRCGTSWAASSPALASRR